MLSVYAIIVDDYRSAIDNLKAVLKAYPFIHIVAEATTVEDAEKEILFHKPDLVFLDIELNKKQVVFPMLERLKSRNMDFGIIFLTAYYQDYLEKVLETCSFTNRFFYLSKPIIERKLQSCLEQFKEFFEKKNRDRLVIRNKDGFYQVLYDDIVYLQTDDNYCNVFLSNGKKISISVNLTEMENYLPKEKFYRMSGKHLIHRDYVRSGKIQRGDIRFVCIIEKGGIQAELPIPEKKWQAFKSQFPPIIT